MARQDEVILEMKDVKVHFHLDEGVLKAVDGIDLRIKRGKTLGIVGESGCGKSVTSQALLRIVPKPGEVEGEIMLYRSGKGKEEGIDLIQLDPRGKEVRDIRGGEIAMIFQEPMKAFSPIHTIGNQIMEAILLHATQDKEEAYRLGVEILRKVGMSNPEQRMGEYPHQLSGGMRQRAMIAMALSCNPSILIADEPTTALDVTVQAQVLQLINDLKANNETSVIFITHDLGVIAEMSDDVAVMYLGKVVEYTDVDTLFHGPKHPYTRALLNSIPAIGRETKRLESIEGTVPFPMNLPKGCGFYSRCKQAVDGVCNIADVPLVEAAEGHYVRCLLVKTESTEPEVRA
ncbi:ABC transporter ATP-binding protein [Paenibacillus alginolyticus]|uniref:ABC transporter ATP-binding protein n=1 Tax=Paenibacillus alginolyticus TaxID=59839 RepID=A0ABT4GMM7_9BACL|nr:MULTISPECIES: ABC transporter ATP-binding protein [Paenibacillus]MCY9669186.1 ABC transporter ATP-binding protein [Paenibacillus alginolyticus]MCY9697437.1 ABC transporter ATP-binding protein [Paenibacillus alginolyticus]MEC0148470.1 ABC transporter ATP-binding protein [Paenibacillus alginolyticus]NRF95382.1 ABC transporter ATP-binding protein [Paenibacillus frigoriresistens]